MSNINSLKYTWPIFLATLFGMAGCKGLAAEKPTDANTDCQRLQAKSEIEAVIKSVGACTKKRDIACFMASCDDTFILESNESADKDRVIVKDSLQQDILLSWSIIARFFEVETWIDSMALPTPDTAIVFTNQFFHRTFLRPNNQPGEDDVVSTQRHRETWIKRPTGWKQSRIKELGGAIYVNGKPYDAEGE